MRDELVHLERLNLELLEKLRTAQNRIASHRTDPLLQEKITELEGFLRKAETRASQKEIEKEKLIASIANLKDDLLSKTEQLVILREGMERSQLRDKSQQATDLEIKVNLLNKKVRELTSQLKKAHEQLQGESTARKELESKTLSRTKLTVQKSHSKS